MAVITISRQFGAGARTLGERLGKTLGYRFVHEDMIKEVARLMKASDKQVRDFEKRGSTKLLKFLDKIVNPDFITRLVADSYVIIDEKSYVDSVTSIIKRLYNEGNVVIIGRGSQFILKGYEDAYHILLVSDLEHRTRFLTDKYQLNENQALNAIKRADEIRSGFLSFFCPDTSFHDNPVTYHLAINMQRVSLEKAEEMIVKLISHD
jgi:cytidylate kinase